VNLAYAALMLAAFGTAWLVARAQRVRLVATPKQRLGVALGAFVGAMLGAKLPFVLSDGPGLLSGAAWFDSGKTITTGLVGGYFGVEVAKRLVGIRHGTGDVLVVPVAAGIAVGRLACLVGGCCFGTATTLPWGVDFGDGVHRHPTQVYEALFHAGAASGLAALRARGVFPRQLMKLYVIAYLVFRFATEYVRPEPAVALGLTAYQWAAIVFVPVFAALWARDRAAVPAPDPAPASEAEGA
jgi:phosphatidylglycerol:prolipoprotein diacylglycerol transferase